MTPIAAWNEVRQNLMKELYVCQGDLPMNNFPPTSVAFLPVVYGFLGLTCLGPSKAGLAAPLFPA